MTEIGTATGTATAMVTTATVTAITTATTTTSIAIDAGEIAMTVSSTAIAKTVGAMIVMTVGAATIATTTATGGKKRSVLSIQPTARRDLRHSVRDQRGLKGQSNLGMVSGWSLAKVMAIHDFFYALFSV